MGGGLSRGSVASPRSPVASTSLTTGDWRLDSTALQIQPPVIEQEGRVIIRCLAGQLSEEVLTQFCLWQTLQVAMQNDALHKALELARGFELRGRFLQACFDLLETCFAHAVRGGLGIGELPGKPIADKMFCIRRGLHQPGNARQQAREIVAASALRNQRTVRTQRAIKIAKQPVVVEHPVERSCAEDQVELTFKGQFEEIAATELNPAAKIGFEVGASRVEHVLGNIECNDVSARQSFKQVAREASGAATSVEHPLVAAQPHAREHLFAPAYLGSGDLVVESGVPFLGH